MSAPLTKEELAELIKEVVEATIQSHPLTSEELHWVRMAIKAEAERAELRRAIIQKSLAGLVWAALATGGMYFVNFITSHWK